MSCNCTSTIPYAPDGSALPSIDELSALNAAPVNCGCCDDPSCLDSDPTGGGPVPTNLMDTVCATSEVTLLGRVGSIMARLAGDGFLKITNGKASVVSSIPIKVRSLWHRWWKPTALQRPILGEPLPFPYLVVADAQGNLHGIKGVADAEAGVIYWDSTAGVYRQTDFNGFLEHIAPVPAGDGTYVLKYRRSVGRYWSPANP